MNLTQDLEIMVTFWHLSTSRNNQIRFQVNVSTKLLEQADILLLEQEDSGYVGDMFGFWVEGVIQVSSLRMKIIMTSWPYFKVKLSCVCLMFADRKNSL